MDNYHVEAYRWLRDHAKPISQQDAADLAEVRKFGGLDEARASKMRILRQRMQAMKPFVEKPRAYPEPKPETVTKRASNQWYKEQMALLGGTRTIAPAGEPLVEQYYRPKSEWYYVPDPRNTELYPEPKPFTMMTEERACALVRDHLVAMGKAGLDVDMFMILRVFPSYEAYGAAIKAA